LHRQTRGALPAGAKNLARLGRVFGRVGLVAQAEGNAAPSWRTDACALPRFTSHGNLRAALSVPRAETMWLQLAATLHTALPAQLWPLGLGTVGPLLRLRDERLIAPLERLRGMTWPEAPHHAWRQPAARALGAWLGGCGRITLGTDAHALLAMTAQQACAASSRNVVLALEPLAHRPVDALPVARLDVARRLAGGDVAALVFEPWVERADDGVALRAVLAAARAAGVRVIADETRTAGRVHRGASTLALGLDADVLVVGSSVACGAPFAACIELRAREGVAAVDPPPSALALALAWCNADALRAQPVCAELASWGDDLQRAFSAACARERIVASVLGAPALGRIQIPAQEGVASPLLHWQAGVELERAGVIPSEWCVVHAGWREQGEPLRAALTATVGRLRTRLIEHNSYISGGLDYVFATDEDALRARGLGIYRYPKQGPVAVTAGDNRVRIAFAAGPLGEIVSSGFFVPARITGDFEVEADYELLAWSAGPDSACFGFFFQNDLSTGRYYAQRTIDSGGDHVLAGLDGVLSRKHPVGARAGSFRLTRAGRRVTAWHREPEQSWRELGSTDVATGDDGVIGAKIWAKVACDGLTAEVTALRLRAKLSPMQDGPLPVRPDPRRSS
jgi:hypothetical protein